MILSQINNNLEIWEIIIACLKINKGKMFSTQTAADSIASPIPFMYNLRV
jgi:hypothetical protein